ERAVGLVELLVRQVQAPGNVTRPQPRARLRLGSGEAAPRAGVEHLLAPRPEVAAHAQQIAHQSSAQARGEAARPRCRLARGHRTALGAPAGEAAVEDGDPVVAKTRKVHQTRAALTTPRE